MRQLEKIERATARSGDARACEKKDKGKSEREKERKKEKSVEVGIIIERNKGLHEGGKKND